MVREVGTVVDLLATTRKLKLSLRVMSSSSFVFAPDTLLVKSLSQQYSGLASTIF